MVDGKKVNPAELLVAVFGGGIGSHVLMFALRRFFPSKSENLKIEETIRAFYEHHIKYLQEQMDDLRKEHTDCEKRCAALTVEVRTLGRDVQEVKRSASN